MTTLISLVAAGKRCAILSGTKTHADKIFKALKSHFGDTKSILYYSRDTPGETLLKDLANVNKAWMVDVLIYTPTITVRVSLEQTSKLAVLRPSSNQVDWLTLVCVYPKQVSIDVHHFDHLFVYSSGHGCGVRDVFQGLIRVRNFSSPELY